jgi:hypothetical protein
MLEEGLPKTAAAGRYWILPFQAEQQVGSKGRAGSWLERRPHPRIPARQRMGAEMVGSPKREQDNARVVVMMM